MTAKHVFSTYLRPKSTFSITLFTFLPQGSLNWIKMVPLCIIFWAKMPIFWAKMPIFEKTIFSICEKTWRVGPKRMPFLDSARRNTLEKSILILWTGPLYFVGLCYHRNRSQTGADYYLSNLAHEISINFPSDTSVRH